MDNLHSVRLVSAALLASTALPSAAVAQVAGSGTAFKQVDANGVDVTSGAYELQIPLGAIGGSSPGALTLTELLSGSSGHNLQAYFTRSESGSTVGFSLIFGAFNEGFSGPVAATSFTSDLGTGATLTKLTDKSYRYTAADGTITTYGWPSGMPYLGGNAGFCVAGNEAACTLLAQSTTSPAGVTQTYGWRAGQKCQVRPDGETFDCLQFYRLASVNGSGGWKIVFTYQSNTDPTSYMMPPDSWYKRTGATFWNGLGHQVGAALLSSAAAALFRVIRSGCRGGRSTALLSARSGYPLNLPRRRNSPNASRTS